MSRVGIVVEVLADQVPSSMIHFGCVSGIWPKSRMTSTCARLPGIHQKGTSCETTSHDIRLRGLRLAHTWGHVCTNSKVRANPTHLKVKSSVAVTGSKSCKLQTPQQELRVQVQVRARTMALLMIAQRLLQQPRRCYRFTLLAGPWR